MGHFEILLVLTTNFPSSQFFPSFPIHSHFGTTCKIKNKKKKKKKKKKGKLQKVHPSNSSRFLNQIINRRINAPDRSFTQQICVYHFYRLREKHIVFPLSFSDFSNFLQIHHPNSNFTLIVVHIQLGRNASSSIFYRTYKIIKVKIDRLLSLFN